ncbi:RING/U-box superfamily protein [Abeliophyllum distichum]|uniref:RING/U-box superfamily protein n=1 Tax=Abeliophyllum distichum TaxID=126358 RepID=A0ABD1NNV9_9LAMI
MSGGSTSRNHAEISANEMEGLEGELRLVVTSFVFGISPTLTSQDSHPHSLPTKKRLLSASDFILIHSYDRPSQELENLMKSSTETYLRAGKESRRRFLAAKLMASNMICLEDSIIRATPDQKYNDVSDELVYNFYNDWVKQKDLEDGDEVAGMGYCKHEYHAKCITKWLYDHNCCPMCKELALSPRVGYPNWVTNLDMLRGFLKRGDVYSHIHL